MELFYYCKKTNFGDAINPWFWPHYINFEFTKNSDQLMVGIGTLINNCLPESYRKVHIVGSGAGYGKFVPELRENWKVHFVRGPITAKALGLSETTAIADPAILLNELISVNNDRKFPCGFMPHISVDSPRLRTVVEQTGFLYISPCDDPLRVIHQVNLCEKLICSAMHGAILAEALRIPWYPIATSHEILKSKWQDWFLSMNIKADLHKVPSIWPAVGKGAKGKLAAFVKEGLFSYQLHKIFRRGPFILGSESHLSIRKDQLKEALVKFNKYVQTLT